MGASLHTTVRTRAAVAAMKNQSASTAGRTQSLRQRTTDTTSETSRLPRFPPASILERMKGKGTTATKVLVIDDAVDVRERLCQLLAEQAGADAVGSSANRDEALRYVSELRPACVVIDVPVHDMAGFDLVSALRNFDRGCLLIVLTNHATEEFRQRSIIAGADHFLAKSTEFDRVAELVRTLGERP